MLVSALSLSDAPGCTTAAMAIAHSWPRPVLVVEADTAHATSVLPGYFKAEVPQRGGVLDLAARHRAGSLTEADLFAEALPVPGETERWVIPGFIGPGPAVSAAPSWGALAGLFHRLDDAGIDVIADLGRLGASDDRNALLARADAVAVFAVADLPSLYSVRARLGDLRGVLGERSDGPAQDDEVRRLGIVLRQHPSSLQDYSQREVRSTLNAPLWGTLPWDPQGAAVFSHGASAKSAPWGPRRYARAAAALATTIATAAQARREKIGTAAEGSQP